MPPHLLKFLHEKGLMVLEAYGLSENTVPIAANRTTAYRFGSVGKALATNEIRFASDGEILVRGPGYFMATSVQANHLGVSHMMASFIQVTAVVLIGMGSCI